MKIYNAFAMGFVGLVVTICGVFAKGDTHQTIFGIVGARARILSEATIFRGGAE